jgi:hypothetical protein
MPALMGAHTSGADFVAQFQHAVEATTADTSAMSAMQAMPAPQSLVADQMPLPKPAAPAPRPAAPSRKHDDEPRTASLIRSNQFNAMAGAPITLPTRQDNSPAAAAPESGSDTPAATSINTQQPALSAQVAAAAPAPDLPPATLSDKAAPAPLSFAAKIQTSTDSKPTADPSQRIGLNDNVNAVAAAWKKGQREEQQPQQQDSAVAPVPAAAPAAPAAAPVFNAVETAPATVNPIAAPQAPKTHEEAPLSAARALDARSTIQPQTPATGQLKDVSFRIAQEDGSSVQLRLTQQAGELKLAVHTASPDLNQGLRDSLPDLTKKLSDTGFHAETWRPGVSAAPAAAEGEAAGHSGSNPQGGNSQQQSGSGQQGNARRDQEQSSRPQWVEELENGVQSTSSFRLPGDLHGFVS